jgi:hypothetical protein
MTERARKLTNVADLSAKFGLLIRNRWLPRFDDVCQSAYLVESMCPSQLVSVAARIRADLCAARNDLQAGLPYSALTKVDFKKEMPPLPPRT